jgi:hypothetical protein
MSDSDRSVPEGAPSASPQRGGGVIIKLIRKSLPTRRHLSAGK